MISYELAKQLKDAGFPQKIDKSSGVDQLLGGVPCAPTLSELIEALPKIFTGPSGTPYYFTLWAESHEWQCAWIPLWKEEMWMGYFGYGFTPEEAIAKLWLDLNQK